MSRVIQPGLLGEENQNITGMQNICFSEKHNVVHPQQQLKIRAHNEHGKDRGGEYWQCTASILIEPQAAARNMAGNHPVDGPESLEFTVSWFSSGLLFGQGNRKIWAQKATFSDHNLGELSGDRLQGQFATTTPSMHGPVSGRTDMQPHDCVGAVNSRFAQFRSVLGRMPRQRAVATIGSTLLRSATCRWPGAGKQPREFAICAIFPLVSEMVQHRYSLPIEKTSGQSDTSTPLINSHKRLAGKRNEGVASRDIGSFILARECRFLRSCNSGSMYEGSGSYYGTIGRTRPGGRPRGTECRGGFNQPASARINGICPDHEAAQRCLEISTCGLFCEF
ncbi:hypothetical protein B0H19DRAFT_1063060 [Mycena capillaripes]|nr:hypothetical protein B0H19DRAFT_1063060 [Mycena capillaripes]